MEMAANPPRVRVFWLLPTPALTQLHYSHLKLTLQLGHLFSLPSSGVEHLGHGKVSASFSSSSPFTFIPFFSFPSSSPSSSSPILSASRAVFIRSSQAELDFSTLSLSAVICDSRAVFCASNFAITPLEEDSSIFASRAACF